MWYRCVAMCAFACLCLGAYAQGEVKWLETEHDFGTFQEVNGKVSCVMRMVNSGDKPLVITRVQSSCGCTATEFTRDEVAPGDTARVTLTYNPKGRPGKFEKDVYVYTTGVPRRSQLSIKGKVIESPLEVDKRYPVAAGALRMENKVVPMGELKRSMRGSNASIAAYNVSPDTIVLFTQGSNAHVEIKALPDTVPPGDVAALLIHYRAKEAPLWGFNVDTLVVSAEPLHESITSQSGLARIYVMAQVLEDFDGMTPEQREKAPALHLTTDKVDCDRITQRQQHAVELHNTGHSDLLVRRVWCPEPAVKAVTVPDKVKKGKRAQVVLEVDPALIEGGMLNTTVTIMTNDPDSPVQQVRVVGLVAK